MINAETINKELLNHFPGNNLIHEMCRYQLNSTGKRLRALIPQLVYESYEANSSNHQTLSIALCCEILHNATLVHDDIQDQDEFRRGIPTVWKKFGLSHAIDCGNYLFQSAYTLLNHVQLFQTALYYSLKVVEGQTLEHAYKTSTQPRWEEYLKIVSGKTSSYLILPALLAAVSINKEQDYQIIIQMFDQIGIAFQILDDYTDIYGDKNRNEFASDLAEGKISALITKVFEVASTDEKNLILNILHIDRTKTTYEQKLSVVDIFNKYEIQKSIKNAINLHLNTARTISKQSIPMEKLFENFTSTHFQAFL